jgi:hypothetical protein
MNLPSHLPAFIPPMTQCRETAKKTKAATVSRNCFTATRFYTAWPGQMSVMAMLRQPPMGRVREVTSPSHSPSIGISNDEYSLKEKAPGATSLGRDAEILIAL